MKWEAKVKVKETDLTWSQNLIFPVTLTVNSKAIFHCLALLDGVGPSQYFFWQLAWCWLNGLWARCSAQPPRISTEWAPCALYWGLASPPKEAFVLTRPKDSFLLLGLPLKPMVRSSYGSQPPSKPHPCQPGVNPTLWREPPPHLFFPLRCPFSLQVFSEFSFTPSFPLGRRPQQDCCRSSWRALSLRCTNYQREMLPVLYIKVYVSLHKVLNT